jgi:hypothetical protein
MTLSQDTQVIHSRSLNPRGKICNVCITVSYEAESRTLLLVVFMCYILLGAVP